MKADRHRPGRHGDAVGTFYRCAMKLLTMTNAKTVKGEKLGYLSSILYLMPHTSGGGVTLCPHSTPACREMCLAGAGLSGLPKQLRAKQRRTDYFLADAVDFSQRLSQDIAKLVRIARAEDMKPVVRLNGTSDIIWERVAPELFICFPDVQFMDYTKIPVEHRSPPPNYHLTFSIEGPADMERAVGYLARGQSVAAVVPEDDKWDLLADESLPWRFVDGDEHDLRFLDPPGSIVLLKPKGHVRTTLMRTRLFEELRTAARHAGAMVDHLETL